MKLEQPNLKKINAPVFMNYCGKYKLDLALGVTTKVAVQLLSDAMATRAEKIATCELCGGDSDATLQECPFCGDVDVTGNGSTPTPTASGEVKAMTKKTASKTAATKKTASKKAATKKTASKKAATKKTASKKAATKKTASKKAATKKTASKKAATKKTASKKAATKKTASKETAIQKPTPGAVTAKELAMSMDKVKSLQMKGIECMWELGRELFEMYNKKLYTQMTVEGKPLYSDWTTFSRKELGITKTYAFKLMDVAINFDKQQIANIGVTKLNLLVRVPEEKREEMLATAKDTPRGKLAQEVREIVKNKGPRETGRQKFKGKSGKGRAAAPRSEKITVTRSEPRVVVDLFKRDTTERAKSVDDAFGIEQCANGVTVQYTLVRTEKGLSIAIETRRE